MYLKYNISSYLVNLDIHYIALDGCSTNTAKGVLSSQNYYPNNSRAELQCCSIDGQHCQRRNPLTKKCWSGDNDVAKVTWYEAYERCTSAGHRLCKSQEELNRCCGSGCHYDDTLMWTSLQAGAKLQGLHRQ